MRDDLLKIYLNDHLTGSVAAVELAERSLENNHGNELGAFMRDLLSEIKEDQETLKDVIHRIGGEENPVKKALGWLAEKVGRAKLNDDLFEYSELSRVIELEILMLGVRGKLGLWKVLESVTAEDERFRGIDFPHLIKKAERQHNELDNYRLKAAQAFKGSMEHDEE